MDRREFLKSNLGLGMSIWAVGTAGATSLAADKDEWKPLFDGKTLAGWKSEGKAVWLVEDGCLTGVQGPGAAPGDLFTEKEYGDFELKLVYKIHWPANSGVWFRYQSPDKSYQADILEYKNPEAYSGTLYCPGKMFLFINKDRNLEKHDDWNTMIIRAKGSELSITLNGVKTGETKEDSFDKGRIGFQVHPGDEFKTMKISVKEMMIKEMAK